MSEINRTRICRTTPVTTISTLYLDMRMMRRVPTAYVILSLAMTITARMETLPFRRKMITMGIVDKVATLTLLTTIAITTSIAMIVMSGLEMSILTRFTIIVTVFITLTASPIKISLTVPAYLQVKVKSESPSPIVRMQVTTSTATVVFPKKEINAIAMTTGTWRLPKKPPKTTKWLTILK